MSAQLIGANRKPRRTAMKLVKPRETLDSLVSIATDHFVRADRIAAKAQADYRSARIAAGDALNELRERVEAGEAGELKWWDWYETRFRRSRRDAEKVMALAAAPDPQGAHAKEKDANRIAVAAHRSRLTVRRENSSTESTKPALRIVKSAPQQEPEIRWPKLQAMAGEFLELTHPERYEYLKLIKKHYRD
jgi:hypothetical protein